MYRIAAERQDTIQPSRPSAGQPFDNTVPKDEQINRNSSSTVQLSSPPTPYGLLKILTLRTGFGLVSFCHPETSVAQDLHSPCAGSNDGKSIEKSDEKMHMTAARTRHLACSYRTQHMG